MAVVAIFSFVLFTTGWAALFEWLDGEHNAMTSRLASVIPTVVFIMALFAWNTWPKKQPDSLLSAAEAWMEASVALGLCLSAAVIRSWAGESVPFYSAFIALVFITSVQRSSVGLFRLMHAPDLEEDPDATADDNVPAEN